MSQRRPYHPTVEALEPMLAPNGLWAPAALWADPLGLAPFAEGRPTARSPGWVSEEEDRRGPDTLQAVLGSVPAVAVAAWGGQECCGGQRRVPRPITRGDQISRIGNQAGELRVSKDRVLTGPLVPGGNFRSLYASASQRCAALQPPEQDGFDRKRLDHAPRPLICPTGRGPGT